MASTQVLTKGGRNTGIRVVAKNASPVVGDVTSEMAGETAGSIVGGAAGNAMGKNAAKVGGEVIKESTEEMAEEIAEEGSEAVIAGGLGAAQKGGSGLAAALGKMSAFLTNPYVLAGVAIIGAVTAACIAAWEFSSLKIAKDVGEAQ